MIDKHPAIAVMNDEDLLASTRELVRSSCGIEAELLLHLAEIDVRKLYAQQAFPSMHVFCVKELGFSDGAAYNRIGVARAAWRWPAVVGALSTGAVHLSGLRVLVPHFTDDNHEALLAEAAGKSKRAIEELAARLSPKPFVPDRVSRLRAPRAASLFGSDVDSDPATSRDTRAVSTAVPVPATRREERRPVVAPLSEDTFKMEFTALRALRDKLCEAQDLSDSDGFARTHVHSVDGIRLACRCHNAHAAEQMYGRVFMDRIRTQRTEAAASARAAAKPTTLPPVARAAASPQQALF